MITRKKILKDEKFLKKENNEVEKRGTKELKGTLITK